MMELICWIAAVIVPTRVLKAIAWRTDPQSAAMETAVLAAPDSWIPPFWLTDEWAR